MAENMFKEKKTYASKKLNKNGVEGREYNEKTDGSNVRVQLFVKDKIVYLSMIYGLKKEALQTEDANKFFNSFTINNVEVSNDENIVYTDSIAGVSFNTPVKLVVNEKMNKQSTSDSWKINAVTGIDSKSGAYIMLISKEVKAGYFIPDDTSVLNDIAERMKLQYADMKVSNIKLQNYNAIELTGKNILNPGISTRILSVIKGNKNATLMVICDSTSLKANKFDGVFNSFKILQYAQLEWHDQHSEESSISMWSPSVISGYETQTYTSPDKAFVAFDTASSTTFFIRTDTLGKYVWSNDDSTFWNNKVSSYLKANDTIYQEQTTTSEKDYIKNYLVRNTNSSTFKRIKLLLHGNILYSVYASGDKDFLLSENVNKLYGSFTVTSKPQVFSLKTPKAEVLIADLASEDSTTRSEAFKALNDADFATSDLPLLHDALFTKYKSAYKDTLSIITNNYIAKKLKKINDPSTLIFIKEHYALLTGDKAYLQEVALSLLVQTHTMESYDLFAQLLQQNPPKDKLANSLSYYLKDSLALTTGIYPALLRFADNSILGTTVASVIITLIDSSFIKPDDVKANENDFIKLAENILPSQKEKGYDHYDYNIFSLIRLLGMFNTPSSLKTLKSYLDVSDLYIKKETLLILLDKKQTVDSAYFNILAADASTCSEFYNDLKEKKKASLFPKKYLTQKNFAASEVYYFASEDDDPSSIKYLSEKIATVKGKKYKFHLFKITFGEDNDSYSYLGFAGGYDIEGKLLETKESFSGIYWDEEFATDQIGTQFNIYLQKLEEGESENADADTN